MGFVEVSRREAAGRGGTYGVREGFGVHVDRGGEMTFLEERL